MFARMFELELELRNIADVDDSDSQISFLGHELPQRGESLERTSVLREQTLLALGMSFVTC